MSGELWTIIVIAGVVVLATGAVTIFLLVRLLRTRKLLTEAGIPVSNKLAFWGAILYVVSPAYLLPDPILLDDIGVLLLALRSLHGAAQAAGLSWSGGKLDQLSAAPPPRSPEYKTSPKPRTRASTKPGT